MFSYFANHSQNTPIGTLTLQELHQQLINPDREPFVSAIKIIQQLRSEPDETTQKLIKGKLLSFTPNAQVDTKDKSATSEQRNIRYSGFMQVDIDLQENPNMTDAATIRDKLAQIPYIALSAISARGKGVWALMALAEPDKFSQYIDQVTDYFRMARITIDKSKSKNLTELRYFAPDPGAILKHEYKLFPLVQQPQNSLPKPTLQSKQIRHTISTLSDLQRWVNETTGYNLVDGQKHYYIFWLSYALRKNGASENEVYDTIYSNILSADRIKSNCISGGIAHANLKGLYTPSQVVNSLQPIPQLKKEIESVGWKIQYLKPPSPSELKRDLLTTDGLLHIYYPGLPELI
jgi:hypothetical protein